MRRSYNGVQWEKKTLISNLSDNDHNLLLAPKNKRTRAYFFTLRHFSVTCNAIFIDEIETANVGLKDPECIAATVIAETRLG